MAETFTGLLNDYMNGDGAKPAEQPGAALVGLPLSFQWALQAQCFPGCCSPGLRLCPVSLAF